MAPDPFWNQAVIRKDLAAVPETVAYGFENTAVTDEFMEQCMRAGIEGLLRFFHRKHCDGERHFNMRIVEKDNCYVALWDGTRWVYMDMEDGIHAILEDCTYDFETWFKSKIGTRVDTEAVDVFVREVVAPMGAFWDGASWIDPDDPIFTDPSIMSNLEYRRRLQQGLCSAILARQCRT